MLTLKACHDNGLNDDHPTSFKSMVDQYAYYLDYYKQRYPKCTVILRNGDFFEIYSYLDHNSSTYANFQEMIDVLFLRPSENKTRYMAGFNTCTKSRYVERLISLGYTVVEAEQDKQGVPDINRFVVAIHSPATYISTLETDNKFLVCIFIEAFKDPDFDPVVAGLSAIDLTTGETKIYQIQNNKDDQNYAFDEVTHFLQSHRPKELLFYSECKIQGYQNNITIEKRHTTLKFQDAMFSRVFHSSIYGLERYTTALTTLTYLLEYCLNHNPILVKDLKLPVFFETAKYLQLANNAITQLDILNSLEGKTASLFNLVNFTNTPMGYRLLKDRLLFPLKDPLEIEERYKLIEQFHDFKKYKEPLSKIKDIEKLFRIVQLNDNPSFLVKLKESFDACLFLFDILPMKYDVEDLKDFFSKIDKTTIFIKGVSEELDLLAEKKSKYINYFNQVETAWAKFGKAEMILDSEGCRFRVTNKVAKMIDAIVLSSNKTSKICTTDTLKSKSAKYLACQEEYQNEFDKIYKSQIEILKGLAESILKLSYFIASVDVAVSSAEAAHKYRYCRPVIKGDSVPNFIKTRKVRHPIIERISKAIYVPHDICLNDKGIILYGPNAAGKSSLMKTIGCNIILAQAGLFVAAEKFSFYPFDNILTRILGNDDMQKGQSSFAVEMTELNGILSRASCKSLILGDEISRGTESDSGIAIVASAIEMLIEKKSKFIFATHLHQLADRGLDIQIYHLGIEKNGKEIIYRRDLLDAAGDSLYGIEVARAMGLPKAFISRALQIRKEMLGEGKKSSYNAELMLEKCGVCGTSASEVHHINPQRIADKDGFIGHFHKNHLRNLVGLCENCHKQQQRDKITITRWVETSDGLKLEWNKN